MDLASSSIPAPVSLPPLMSVEASSSHHHASDPGDEDDEPPLLLPSSYSAGNVNDQELDAAELSPRDAHAGQFRLQLWQFLLLLLSRPDDFGNTIKWTDDSGEFKVFDTEELARLWGGRKGRNTMNYDKLSRSLRYYYDKGILKKVTGQRLVYRFDGDIHRRHVEQLGQGLSGVVALPSGRGPANSQAMPGLRSDSPAAASQHTSDAKIIKLVKRERQERAESGAAGGHGMPAKRPRKEKSGIEEHQANSMEASLLFGRALREGCITIPHTRMFLMGPRRAGKSSLKRLLLGMPQPTDEPPSEGVDADPLVAIFDAHSPYHMDSSVRSALPWRTEEVRYSRLREFERCVCRWVAADLMSFSHDCVQHRMPASQQAVLHNECAQLLAPKVSPQPPQQPATPAAAPAAPQYSGGMFASSGSMAATAASGGSSFHAPVTPSRTPVTPTSDPSPTTASIGNSSSAQGFAPVGTATRPLAVAAPGAGTATARFVAAMPTAGAGASVGALPPPPQGMYWPAASGPGVMGRPPFIQPVYMASLTPGPFFMSAATQPPPAPRYIMPMNAGGDMAMYGTPPPPPPAPPTYTPATGPFPDLPEDLAARVASYLRQARSKGMEFFTDAAVAFPGVTHIWEVPGGAEYCAVASSLMVRHAIYVLTFDLSLDLHSPMPGDDGSERMDRSGGATKTYLDLVVDSLDLIRACTSHHQDSASVQRLVPAIVIVGTHMDLLGPADSEPVKRRAREQFATVKRALLGRLSRKYITFPFFAVNSLLAGHDNEHAGLLRCHIEDVAQTYFPTAWPYSYLRFEQVVEAERRRGLVCLPLADVFKTAKVNCLLEQSATLTMLCHMHNQGLVLYMPRIARMDDLVVIRPQWLLGAINRVICTPPPPQDCVSPATAASWHRLVNEGILEEQLIYDAWQDYGSNQALLLDMMQRMDLVCPSLPHVVDRFIGNSSIAEGGDVPPLESSIYYLPSMVRFGPTAEEFLQSLSPERASTAVVLVFADNFLPGSVFSHLLQRCLLMCPMQPRIFNQCARLVVDSDHDLLLLISQDTLKVIVENTAYSSAASPPHSDVCVEVLRFIVACLHEFAHQYEHGIVFEVCVECMCSAPPPDRPPSGASSIVNLWCSPESGQHYAKLTCGGGGGGKDGDATSAEQLVCARGTDYAAPLSVQVWTSASVHRSSSQSVSECLHYNIRHRLSQLLDPHLGGRAPVMLAALLGCTPHEICRLERSDSLTMSLIEAWEVRSSSSIACLREKVALLRCEDAVDLLDSI